MPHSILIATTTWWPLSARLAMAFIELGCDVAAICPSGNPLLKLRTIRSRFPYRAAAPIRSLRLAIAESAPHLIVPCDDRVVLHLHQLHAHSMSDGADGNPIRAAIEHSLGSPAGYPFTRDREKLLRLAGEAGIRIPNTQLVSGLPDLHAWRERHPFPWVLKVDGTWGGAGVRIVTSWEEAQRAYIRLGRPIGTPTMLKQLLINHDPYPVLPWLLRNRSAVSVQSFIQGRPANTMVACWRGEVLAAISVEVLSAQSRTGASTVVRVIDNPEMSLAASRLAQRLQLTGFCGLDFMIEDKTRAAYLIEMNARSTQLGHLRLGPGRDLTEAMRARLSGVPPRNLTPVTTNDTIAFFPQAWFFDAKSAHLRSAYHDVPWEEPELVRELLRQPWTRRGVFGRMLSKYHQLPVEHERFPPLVPARLECAVQENQVNG